MNLPIILRGSTQTKADFDSSNDLWKEGEIAIVDNKIYIAKSSGLKNDIDFSIFESYIDPESDNTDIIDWAEIGAFTVKDLDDNITFVFNNVIPGKVLSVVVKNPDDYTVNWPETVFWPNSEPPIQDANSTYVYTFMAESAQVIYGAVAPDYAGSYPTGALFLNGKMLALDGATLTLNS